MPCSPQFPVRTAMAKVSVTPPLSTLWVGRAIAQSMVSLPTSAVGEAGDQGTRDSGEPYAALRPPGTSPTIMGGPVRRLNNPITR